MEEARVEMREAIVDNEAAARECQSAKTAAGMAESAAREVAQLAGWYSDSHGPLIGVWLELVREATDAAVGHALVAKSIAPQSREASTARMYADKASGYLVSAEHAARRD